MSCLSSQVATKVGKIVILTSFSNWIKIKHLSTTLVSSKSSWIRWSCKSLSSLDSRSRSDVIACSFYVGGSVKMQSLMLKFLPSSYAMGISQ